MEARQLTIEDILRQSVDPCERKHRGSPESRDAHESIVHKKQHSYEKIMRLYQTRGEYGATSHEVSGATGMPLQTVSARLSELHHTLKKLKKSGERRNGAAVLVIV